MLPKKGGFGVSWEATQRFDSSRLEILSSVAYLPHQGRVFAACQNERHWNLPNPINAQEWQPKQIRQKEPSFGD